jgi:hypothetical protein
MRILFAIPALLSGVTVPSISNAQVDDTVIYSTRQECREALADARDEDPSYFTRECRQEGEGWSFRPKDGAGKDRPDGTRDPGN